MKSYRIILEGQSYTVEILDDPRLDRVRVRVDGELLTVEVSELSSGPQPPSEPIPAPVTTAFALPDGDGPSTLSNLDSHLLAPLPGTVIEISVSPGQAVHKGDDLMVIESMKMNNHIRSPRNGTVAKILVSPARQVSHGEVLLIWES